MSSAHVSRSEVAYSSECTLKERLNPFKLMLYELNTIDVVKGYTESHLRRLLGNSVIVLSDKIFRISNFLFMYVFLFG